MLASANGNGRARLVARAKEVGFRIWMTNLDTHDSHLGPDPDPHPNPNPNPKVLGEDYEEWRLVFADIVSRNSHLHRLRAADLALDTPSYNR